MRRGDVLPGRGHRLLARRAGREGAARRPGRGDALVAVPDRLADDPGQQGLSDSLQRTVEPAFVLVLYALALWGAFLAPRRFVALAGLLLAYSTLAAMVFAGTVRYRAPWDFVLALLAAFALERAWGSCASGAPRPWQRVR